MFCFNPKIYFDLKVIMYVGFWSDLFTLSFFKGPKSVNKQEFSLIINMF